MQAGAGGKKVLIVDDEHAIADSLMAIFRMNGYEVEVAYSAEEAIERIAVSAPDLAVIDVILPGMNGIDFAIALKDIHPHCQFLLFSGSHSTEELLRTAAANGHSFEILAKPVPPTQLLEAAKTLLTRQNERVRPDQLN